MILSRAVTEMEITANLLDYLSVVFGFAHWVWGAPGSTLFASEFPFGNHWGNLPFQGLICLHCFSLQLFTNLGKAKVGLRFEAVKYDELVNFIFLC